MAGIEEGLAAADVHLDRDHARRRRDGERFCWPNE